MNTVEVPLTRGYVAIVDVADAERVLAHKWHAQSASQTVYARRNVRRADGTRTTQYLHQFLTGYQRAGHRNGDGLDNRRSNLRDATAGGISQNTRRRQNNTSGFKGVYWHKAARKWVAQINVDGTHRYLGCYAIIEEAAQAYDDAARELHGEFATLNFPQPGERAA